MPKTWKTSGTAGNGSPKTQSALVPIFLHALLTSERILKGANVGEAEKGSRPNSLATRATNDDKRSITSKVMLRI